jgi:cell division protein FtsL
MTDPQQKHFNIARKTWAQFHPVDRMKYTFGALIAVVSAAGSVITTVWAISSYTGDVRHDIAELKTKVDSTSSTKADVAELKGEMSILKSTCCGGHHAPTEIMDASPLMLPAVEFLAVAVRR